MNGNNLEILQTLINRPAKRIAVKLRSAAQRKISQGHPWIFSDSINKIKEGGVAGDLAIIYHSKSNTFLAAGLYDPDSDIRIKLLVFGKQEIIDDKWFELKILEAFNLREKHLTKKTNAYRVIFGENDGLPSLIVDNYAGHLVLKLYSTIWFPYLNAIIAGLKSVFNPLSIVLRFNRNILKSYPKLIDGLIVHGQIEGKVLFKENNLILQTDLIKGHKTGFFLDHRANRIEISRLSKDKSVLDIFSYIGGFSVHALAGGAKSVVSLDISAKALEQAKRNVELNQLESSFDTMQIDAFEGMQFLASRGEKFDLVIVDPPSFAKNKSQIDKAINSYQRLLDAAIVLVKKGGILLFCSCSSRIKREEFRLLVINRLESNSVKYEFIKITGHDFDHPISIPEMEYLKSIYLKII